MWRVQYLDERAEAEVEALPDDMRASFARIAGTSKKGRLMRKFIPVEESFARWRKDPAFMAAYDALEEEFALATALIAARGRANLSQAELAERMNTSQSAIARLESGKTWPSTRTLRKLAEATGSKLRISLEPDGPRRRA